MPVKESALEGWREVLGRDRVIDRGEELERAQQCTYELPQRASALLRPENLREVQECLRVAREQRVPLYPISGGKNWGYGSRLPSVDGAVLLSLERMNRIVDFSEELGYVIVEPGVTFRMLAAFLRQRGSALLPPSVGTRGDASLVGNVLERGVGKGLYEELSARSLGYEAVLPNGQVVRTGFTGLPHAQAGALRAEAFGPALQGLFAQSNLAVVTRLTLWLDPAPIWRHRVWFGCDATELVGLVDAVRPLLLRAGNRIQIEVANDYRVAAANGQYPFASYPEGEVLPREELTSPRWVGSVICWADDEEELNWRRRLAWKTLNGAGLEPLSEETSSGLEPEQGDGLLGIYWRKRAPAPSGREPETEPEKAPDPDRDRCGVIWHPPVLPMLGPLVGETVQQIEQLLLDWGFEPFISLRMASGRALHAIVGLTYDRDVPGADRRAARCHQALREAMRERGVYPYRLGLIDMDDQPDFNDDSRGFLRALKELVDPGSILAPGRYLPVSDRERA